MRIVLGCDHAGLRLKEKLAAHIENLGHSVEDMGTYTSESVDYPVYAARVARAVSGGEAERGVLVCGSGIGMCITANRFRRVRAVMASEPFAAKMSRRHNDSNILCLGERFIGEDLAVAIVEAWIEEPFEGGRHKRRVDLIDRILEDG